MKVYALKTLKYVVPALIVALSLGYLSARPHILMSVPSEGVFYNGRPLPNDAPYLVYKTSSGEVFCNHLRGGPQYLISPARGQVSIISKDVEVENFGPVRYTREVLSRLSTPEERKLVPDARLVSGDGYVEFTGLNYVRWRISY